MNNIICLSMKNISNLGWGFLNDNLMYGRITIDNLKKVDKVMKTVNLGTRTTFISLKLTFNNNTTSFVDFQIPDTHNYLSSSIEFIGDQEDNTYEVWGILMRKKDENDLHEQLEASMRQIPEPEIKILC